MDRMRFLIDTLNKYAYHYYVLDEPIVADKEYDVLYDELVRLERENGVVQPDSPTRRVGGETIKQFNEYRHRAKLYSLDKAQNYEELEAFFTRNQKAFGDDVEYTVEYKFDGLTINLTYENGAFVRAATRGNGEVGEDVTAQVLTIRSFPMTIDYPGTLEIQGEGIMRKSVFERYNKSAAEPLKNPRNGVAGAIRNLDPKVTAARKLDIMFYNIGYMEEPIVSTQSQCIEFLTRNKFKVSPFFKVVKSFDEIRSEVERIGASRGELDFLIDGAVVKLNDFRLRDELGFTEKFPRWAIAFKYEAEEMTTILRDVVWQVGRTGKLTPTALLEPVELAGVTVKRATLNNMGDIERKGVKKGARVLIRRSNDVIPEILGVTEYYEDNTEIRPPTVCPACGTELIEDGANLFCPNFDNCPPQIVARLEHFASKDAMDIEGFSEKTAEQFYNELHFTGVHDLFELKKETLLKLEGFKEKKAENLLAAIEKCKDVELSSFLFALGILNVGKKTAKQLAQRFKTLEALKKATVEELTDITDIGDVVAGCIVQFFSSEKNLAAIDKLLASGVTIRTAESEEKIGSFAGQHVVLTGTLARFTRSEAAKLIEERGGEIESSVTNATTLVLAGEKAGSKLDKAKKKGIRILTEEEFVSMLGQTLDS